MIQQVDLFTESYRLQRIDDSVMVCKRGLPQGSKLTIIVITGLQKQDDTGNTIFYMKYFNVTYIYYIYIYIKYISL
jgi:hypothetical protein